MSKIRVYELAKELNVSSKELIELLMTEFNVEVKNHMSVIEDEDAALIKELLGEPNKDEASKEVSADNGSIVEEYEEQLNEEVNKGNRKKKKTRKQIAEEKARREQEFAENTILEIGETITVKELADSLQKPYANS